MSHRDLPLWARAAAIGLLLFASWWLIETEGIRNVVGDSVAQLCLGVVALSVLRGMHLPLGLWPEGPWRQRFSVLAVVVAGAAIAGMILLSRASLSEALVAHVEPGTFGVVIAGTVVLGFGLGFVKQRRYLAWYATALGLAALPLCLELLFGAPDMNGAEFGPCYISMPVALDDAGSGLGCGAALLPSLVFLTALGATAKLVTEEFAFRRLLIGLAPGAGTLSILVSTATACLWYVVLSRAGLGGVTFVVLGTIGAFSAGCLYVLSRSLLVSALYSGVHYAAYSSLALSIAPQAATDDIVAVSAAAWIGAAAVSLALAAVIARRNGLFGNLKQAMASDASSS